MSDTITSQTPRASERNWEETRLLEEIDGSCRWPVMILMTSALAWLLLGTFVLLINFLQFLIPGFLMGQAWTGYGRVQAASMAMLLYGFAVPAGLAVIVWMFCRLGRAILRGPVYLALGAGFWNLGLLVGVVGIMAGYNTGYEWLEMPGFAAVMLFVSYALMATWIMITFHFGTRPELYVSHWFLLAALLWFPWIFSMAQLLLVVAPVRGALQGVVNLWFINNFTEMWLTAIGLGMLFYFIPKLTGRPLHSFYLAVLTFLFLIVFATWGGVPAGTPVPKWIPTVSIVGTVMGAMGVLAAALNFHLTLAGKYRQLQHDLLLRFILVGAASYLMAAGLKLAGSLRTISEVTHFTLFNSGVEWLYLFGFFGMTLSGAAYFFVPRVMGCETIPARWARMHFWLATAGLALLVLPHLFGGVLQGIAINISSLIPVADATMLMIPFKGAGFVGLGLLLAGQTIFMGNLLWLTGRTCCLPYIRLRKAEVEPVGGTI